MCIFRIEMEFSLRKWQREEMNESFCHSREGFWCLVALSFFLTSWTPAKKKKIVLHLKKHFMGVCVCVSAWTKARCRRIGDMSCLHQWALNGIVQRRRKMDIWIWEKWLLSSEWLGNWDCYVLFFVLFCSFFFFSDQTKYPLGTGWM